MSQCHPSKCSKQTIESDTEGKITKIVFNIETTLFARTGLSQKLHMISNCVLTNINVMMNPTTQTDRNYVYEILRSNSSSLHIKCVNFQHVEFVFIRTVCGMFEINSSETKVKIERHCELQRG